MGCWFDTADDITYTLNLTYDATNNVANFVVGNGPLPDGNYRLKVLSSITDLVGNPLGGGVAYTQTFAVANGVPPDGQVFEGSSNSTYTTATPLTISADPNNTGCIARRLGTGRSIPATTKTGGRSPQTGDHVDVRSGVNGSTSFSPYIYLYKDNGASNPSGSFRMVAAVPATTPTSAAIRSRRPAPTTSKSANTAAPEPTICGSISPVA